MKKTRLLIPVMLLLLSGLAGCSDEALSTAPLPNPAELATAVMAPVAPTTTPEPTGEMQSPPAPTLLASATQVQPAVTIPSVAPTQPAPPLFPIPGIELHNMDTTQLELVIRANGYWVRRNALLWSAVEPEEGLRSWGAVAALERELVNAAQVGLPVVLVLRSTPSWAQQKTGYSCGRIAQDKLDPFGRFVYDAVRRYSIAPYNVKYWELWNEPDVEQGLVSPDSAFGCWGDAADPYFGGGYYARMLVHAYQNIKAADPDSQVLVGGLLLDCDPVNPPEGKTCQSSRFLEGILRENGGKAFDGVSFHAYDYYDDPFQFSNSNWNSRWDITGPVLAAKARFIRSLLAAYQVQKKFLMNTESGLLCGRTGEEPRCQTADYELTKAIYLAKANLTALAEGLRGNIWYSLEGWRGTWLVDNSMLPLPAFVAFQFSAAELRDAALVRRVTDIPGVTGYELQQKERRILVLWSLDMESHPVVFDQPPRSAFDIFGKAQVAPELVIGPQPLYLEWALP